MSKCFCSKCLIWNISSLSSSGYCSIHRNHRRLVWLSEPRYWYKFSFIQTCCTSVWFLGKEFCELIKVFSYHFRFCVFRDLSATKLTFEVGLVPVASVPIFRFENFIRSRLLWRFCVRSVSSKAKYYYFGPLFIVSKFIVCVVKKFRNNRCSESRQS